MPLVPLTTPPGLYKNGTPYQKKGRWIDGNLIRFRDNAVENIGGWAVRAAPLISANVDAGTPSLILPDFIDGGTPSSVYPYVDGGGVRIPPPGGLILSEELEAVRDMFAWRSLAQDQHLVTGSNLRLLHISQLGRVTDITPAGATQTSKDPLFVAGYGRNPYNTGAYGVANTLVASDPLPPVRWVFDTFGEVLLFGQTNFGQMYELNLSTLSVAPVANAPNSFADVVVTDQRIVMTIGANGLPRSIKWSDQENRTVWAPTVSNQAGDFTLPGTGKLMRGISYRGQVLIISENDAYVASYIGAPYVFGFNMVGRDCGPACPQAVVGTDKFVVWWSVDKFWLYSGDLTPLNCEVIEYLQEDVNRDYVSKISTVVMSRFSEVWWFYQSKRSDEVDSYVKWNYQTNVWDTGRLRRTAGIDEGVIQYPTMITPDGNLMMHEYPGVYPDGEVFVETGVLEMASGEVNLALRALYLDTDTFGEVEVIAFVKQFPTGPESMVGPYEYNNPTPMRVMGREVRLLFNRVGNELRIGEMRADVAPQGTGRR